MKAHRSLRHLVVVPLAIVGSLLMGLLLWMGHRNNRDQALSRILLRAETIGNAVGDAAEFLPPDQLQRMVMSFGSEREVEMITVVAGEPAKVVASTTTDWMDRNVADIGMGEDGEDFIRVLRTKIAKIHFHEELQMQDYTIPTTFKAHPPGSGEDLPGAVMVHLDLRRAKNETLQSSAIMGAGGAVAMLLLCLLPIVLIHEHALEPIARIAKALELRGQGNTKVRAPETGGSEISALAHSLNDALDTVEASQESLRQSERFTRMVINLVPAMIWVKDWEGRCILANDARATFLGKSPEELTARQQQALHGEELEHERRLMLSEGPAVVSEECSRDANGNIRWLYTTYTALKKEGTHPQLLCVAIDITERKESQTRILTSLKEVKDLQFALDASAITAVTDHRGIITSANDRFCEISGYSREELLGRDHRIVKSGHHPREFMRDLWTTIQQGKIWRGEICNRSKNGRLYWVDSTIVPFLDESGKPVRYISIRHDITARHLAEQALQESSALRNAIFFNSPLAIITTDTNGLITDCNPAAERLTGYPGAELIRKNSPGVFHDPVEVSEKAARYGRDLGVEIKPGFDAFVAKTRMGHPNEDEWIYVTREGARVPVWLTITALRDSGGEIQGYLGMASDISRRKEAEAEVRRVNQELLSLSRMAGMSEVATSVLHNVGNVLNSVNVSSQILAKMARESRVDSLGKLARLLQENSHRLGDFMSLDSRGKLIPDFIRQLSEHLKQEQDRMLQEMEEIQERIDHIKKIVAMQQGFARVGGIRERLNPVEVMEDAIRINHSLLSDPTLELIRDFEEAPEFMGDKHKTLQILVNLVRNAVDACRSSGRNDSRITLRLRGENDAIRMTVADNGVGISAENLSRIFQHGFTTKREGHGFGLHSSALSAREMGGKLEVTSDGAGRGTTFTLELPALKDMQTPEATS